MSRGQPHSLLLRSLREKLPDDLRAVLSQLNPSDKPSIADRDYGRVLANASRHVELSTAQFRQDLSASEHLSTEFLNLPLDQRRLHVRDRPKLQTLATVVRLLNLSWDQRSTDPTDSEQLSQLALEVLDIVEGHLERAPVRVVADLRGRGWSLIGNARRIQSDLQSAEDALIRASHYLREGSQDPLEHALVHHFLGRLRLDQRRLDDAMPLLRKACRGYRQIGQKVSQAQVLITLGGTYREAGRIEKALQTMARAESLLPDDHPLLFYVRHNQIFFLVDLGRYAEAERHLEAARPLYAHATEPLIRLRLPWVEGRIAKQTGQLEEAESMFQEIRQGFIQHGIAYDAALVSLELAEIYVQQGRREELKDLVEEMVTIFRSRNVEREALAALLMLQHAVSAENVSLSVIRDIATRLRERAPQVLTPLGSEDL